LISCAAPLGSLRKKASTVF